MKKLIITYCSMTNKLFLVLLIIVKSTVTYGDELSHPPTFEQMRQASKHDDFKKKMLVAQALQYTDDDIKIIKKRNNIRYIIGAAYQTSPHQGYELLMEFFSVVQNNPVGLSLLISFALQRDEDSLLPYVEKLTDSLIQLEQENSFSYYLKACYYFKIRKPVLCYDYLRQGNMKSFNNFFKELSEISISTSLFLGYSKIAAQNHALGLQHDVMIYKKLVDYIVNEFSDKESTALECFKMGEILHHNSSTYLFKIISYLVQKTALEKLKADEFSKVRLQNVKDNIKSLQAMIQIINKVSKIYDIPEHRWIKYYDELYTYSESYAIHALLKEYPVTDTEEK